MKQRIITGLAIIAIVAIPLYFGGIPLRILVFAVAGLAAYETLDIRKKKMNWLLFAFLFASIIALYNTPNNAYFIAITIFIIVMYSIGIWSKEIDVDDINFTIVIALILTLSIKGIIHIYDFGYPLMIFIAISVYGTDTFALFVGMKLGKHKLNPTVSPKKTIEGSIGGYIFGCGLSLLFAYFVPSSLDFNVILFLAFTIPLVSQTGDLAFSLIKRHYDVKDFGSIFPGHGGCLDRIDSLLFALMYVNAILLLVV